MSVLSGLTEYTLPNVNSPAGEFTIKLYCADATLTAPTKQTILSIGELEETADVAPSVQESSTLSISIADDTSIGFWYKALGSECHLKLMILESTVETYYFFGTVQPLQVTWTDHYVNSSDTVFVRSAEIILESFEKKIFDTSMDDVSADIYSRRVANSSDPPVHNEPYTIFRIKHIFASILYKSGINSTYDAADISFMYDLPEFNFVRANTTPEYHFEQLFLVTSWWTDIERTPGDNAELASSFFDGSLYSLTEKFPYLKDFVKCILDSFQLILRFDFTGGRVTIKLRQRGHSEADSARVTMTNKISRTITFASDKEIRGIQATDFYSTDGRWVSIQGGGVITSGDPPSHITIDSSLQALFLCGPGSRGAVNTNQWAQSVWASSATEGEDFDFSTINFVDKVNYYNYSTLEYVDTALAGINRLCEAIVGYIYGRFGKVFLSIETIYGGLTSNNGTTTSQANSRSLMRTSINDGNGAKNYYAQSVKKNPATNKMTVVWLQE